MRILVVTTIDPEDFAFDKSVNKLRDWFDCKPTSMFTFARTPTDASSDLTFLVGRAMQHAHYGYIRGPYWLRGKIAGIPFPTSYIDPTLDRMTISFIRNVIALFERTPDKPLDIPKGLKYADNE